MDAPGPGNKSICSHGSGEDGDRISSLPQNLIEHILTFLPLREAVKTSILSNAWRHKWVNRPSIVFDDQFWTPFPDVQTSAQYYATCGVVPSTIDSLESNVFRVLSYHRGPLREFSLSIPQLRSYPALVDQILLWLYDKRIERLCIEIDGYELPSRCFSFRQLKKLKLSACKFTSSQISFEGFSRLTSLDLRSVEFLDVAGFSLAIRCPFLSALTMTDCGSPSNHFDILIESPNLSLFHCVGSFRSLWVKDAPLLKDVTVHQTASLSESKDDLTMFMKLCGGCPAVERLSISIGLLEDLPRPKYITQMGPFVKLMMLRKLRLDKVCLSSRRNVWGCLFLIEHSPNLQELIIALKSRAKQNEDFTLKIMHNLCGSSKFKPDRLEKVELNQLQGARTEMCFIQWLLSASPVLDKMEITFSVNMLPSDQIRTLKELNGFLRPSNKAEVIIK